MDADVGHPADAKIYLDGRIEPQPDAQIVHPPADASIDAPKPVDAYVCTVHTKQLLLNPALDLAPAGTSWVMQNIDNAFPVVTDDPPLAPHSAPYKAWMGGISGDDIGASSATDGLYQDVQVPAGTTSLVFTGFYDVRTSETGTTVYDRGTVSLTKTDGTPLETIASLSNAAPTAAWTAVSKTFSGNYSSQTVRLKFTTTNDVINATSFYFDTFALTATYCQ
ncbi:MAG TPA: hypothetical protein VMZ53_23570 [Kofleriaceae bacterium]|nr:hypothetical protein [Kofleriaceae bacterium]